MSDTIEIQKDELDTIVENKVEEQLAERQQKTSRRSVLGALAGVAGAGALGYGTGTVAASDPADASGTVYFEQIGDSDHPVDQMFVDEQVNFNETESFDSISTEDLDTTAARVQHLPRVIDKFEYGTLDYYNGDSGSFQVVQSPTAVGDNALENTGSGAIATDIPVSCGQILSYFSRTNDTQASANGAITTIDPNSPEAGGYHWRLRPNSDSSTLFRVDNGSLTELISLSPTMDDGKFYQAEFRWGVEGELEFRVIDADGSELASGISTDETYKQGHIGIRSGSGDTGQIDYIIRRPL